MMFFEPRGGYNGLLVEVKREDGSLDAEGFQRAFLEAADDRGYKTKVCYGLEAVKEGISSYLDIK